MDPEIQELFVAECREHLTNVEGDILALERGPVDTGRVDRLFRSLHTIKGASGYVDIPGVSDLSHALEDVVGRIRSGDMGPGPKVADALLKGVDRLLCLVERRAEERDGIDTELEVLSGLDGNGATAEAAEPAPASPATAVAVAERPEPAAVKPAQKSEAQADSGGADERPENGKKERKDSIVRIPVSLLDRLMNLATELVLVRNQNMQAVEAGDPLKLRAIAQRLSVVTSDLQGSIMQTRMRPIGSVFGRFGRLVRDMGRKLDKEVELDVAGAEVELDKSIIEAIGDPLTHLVRNAVDHGIEAPEIREKVGKHARGRVRLSAHHLSGQVNVRIEDDGAGMDPAKLKQAAIAAGIITRDQAAGMAERDAFNLIFAPGFSMAPEVTDISGRGVGMDVVRSAFKSLGGVVEVASEKGVGTAFTIKLPLTLAIMPALVVSVEQCSFALPQVNLDEVVWLHGAEVQQELSVVDKQEVYWLRGRLIPVLRLSRVLGMDRTWSEAATGLLRPDRRADAPDRRQAQDEVPADLRAGPDERRISPANSLFMLVIRVGKDRYGLLVDQIIDTEEIVVKSLHDELKASGAFAGTTVLGDGRIAMILDVAGIAELGSLRFGNLEREPLNLSSSTSRNQTLLGFDLGAEERFAIPLGLISRVEEITPERIQKANGLNYVELRGETVPLVRIDEVIKETSATYREELLYVIVPRGRRPIGLLAANILDTVEVEGEITGGALAHSGIAASTLINGRLTLLLDLGYLIESVYPSIGELREKEGRRVLLVEDSRFFTALIAPYLSGAGLEVLHAPDGVAALEVLAEESVDIIVSDIEMPRMGGLELARHLRADPAFEHIPLVAVSAVRDPSIDADARTAGFDRFVSKLDQGNLLIALESLCGDRASVREG